MDVKEIIALLPDALKQNQREREDLEKWMTPVARVASVLDLKRQRLANLLNPDEVPDHLVEFLSAIVAMGRDWEPLADATPDQLRQLIPIAAAVWRRKGTDPSWRVIAEGQTGSALWLLTWFYHRTVAGMGGEIHTIPAPGSGSGAYANPERITDLWYADPDEEVDTTLLVRVLNKLRPSGERINLYRALHVDDMLGAGRWLNTGAGTALFNLAARRYRLAASGRYAVDLESAANWEDYHALLLLRLTGSNHVGIYEPGALQSTVSQGYYFEIDAAAGTVELFRVDAGVPSSLVGPVAVPMVEGALYRWSFEGWTGVTATTLRCFWEGLSVIDFDDSDAQRKERGRVSLQAGPLASDTIILTGSLIYGYPVDRTRIGPDP